jgi:acetylornithine/N-succinyldiaminopimelate aminotransferase
VTHVPYGELDAVRSALGPDVAAILVEPIQGEGGVLPAPPGFLGSLRKLADANGAFLIADEIQTGVGRTGAFLSVQREGVTPDIVALAKGLGGGVPIGAMLCRSELDKALPPGSHGSTFGGNPLASAAALAVLDVLERDQLMERAQGLGELLAAGLARVRQRHPAKVAASRGAGLLQALVLADALDARMVLGRLQDAGLLVTIAGGQALRFSPPLVVSEAELGEALAILERVLEAV